VISVEQPQRRQLPTPWQRRRRPDRHQTRRNRVTHPSPTATSPRAAERLTTRRSSGRVPPIASRGVAIEVINGIEINLDGLHDDLAELKPLIRRRARSDALERETAIRAASTEDLTAQREAVRPGSLSPRGSVTVSGASAFLDGALPATVSGPEASVPISKLPRGAGCVKPRGSPGGFPCSQTHGGGLRRFRQWSFTERPSVVETWRACRQGRRRARSAPQWSRLGEGTPA
jgi:hypothetical protein